MAGRNLIKTKMKRTLLITSLLLAALFANGQAPWQYTPTAENLETRKWFEEARFGLFIHWGVYSQLGDGEWVMQVQKIPAKTYEKLPTFFNPIAFDPKEW